MLVLRIARGGGSNPPSSFACCCFGILLCLCLAWRLLAHPSAFDGSLWLLLGNLSKLDIAKLTFLLAPLVAPKEIVVLVMTF